ncbi:MAG: hypothetical protein ACRD1Z_10950, partial [Vicinamibacteria bacterium]
MTTPKEADPKPAGDPKGSGETGNQEPVVVDWAAHIPKEYSAEKLWEPLKGKALGDVLKGYAEGQKYIGGAIRLPGKDAKPEDVEKFRTTELPKLYASGLIESAPESADKYEVTPATVPGGWDETAMKNVRTEAHKLGLTGKQLSGVLNFYA